jgi:chorismate mutase/prephenate dehydratase
MGKNTDSVDPSSTGSAESPSTGAAASSTAGPADSSSLEGLRGRIDEIDAAIQALISERARCAQRIGTLKGLKSTAEYYRPEREAQVLRGVVERNRQGPLRNEEMVRLFRELMSACLAQEEPLKVAYLGPEGTFTQSAVFKHFGHSVRALSVATIDEVFHEVESGLADFGVAPVENSTEGTVNHTLDMFLTSPLKICGEVELRIHQHLMGRMKEIGQIRRVCSHSQSFAQCRSWLAQYLPDAEKIVVSSNAEAARRARDEDGTAALAGEAAAEVYDLRILFSNVEDEADNTTRFLVIGRKLLAPSGQDKTSLLVSARGTESPGVLLHLLDPLARHGINMTRIESRPSRRRKWDYVFFVDVDGHAEDPVMKQALAEVERQASLFRVLGGYPRAVL